MKKYSIYIIPTLFVVALIWFAVFNEQTTTAEQLVADQVGANISNVPVDPQTSASPTREMARSCVTHGSAISYHIHPIIGIVINGERVTVPANIGIDPACMRAIHTHDETGKIHVEYATEQPFTLGDFFANWGETFDKNQILEHVVDDTHRIRMTVNANESDEYENLVLRDGDAIVIYYEEIK